MSRRRIHGLVVAVADIVAITSPLCRVLRGEGELWARIVLRGGRISAAGACLRGPDVAVHEAEV